MNVFSPAGWDFQPYENGSAVSTQTGDRRGWCKFILMSQQKK
jgi:hypothetical protein